MASARRMAAASPRARDRAWAMVLAARDAEVPGGDAGAVTAAAVLEFAFEVRGSCAPAM
jgi:hypothetical protein